MQLPDAWGPHAHAYITCSGTLMTCYTAALPSLLVVNGCHPYACPAVRRFESTPTQ